MSVNFNRWDARREGLVVVVVGGKTLTLEADVDAKQPACGRERVYDLSLAAREKGHAQTRLQLSSSGSNLRPVEDKQSLADLPLLFVLVNCFTDVREQTCIFLWRN